MCAIAFFDCHEHYQACCRVDTYAGAVQHPVGLFAVGCSGQGDEISGESVGIEVIAGHGCSVVGHSCVKYGVTIFGCGYRGFLPCGPDVGYLAFVFVDVYGACGKRLSGGDAYEFAFFVLRGCIQRAVGSCNECRGKFCRYNSGYVVLCRVYHSHTAIFEGYKHIVTHYGHFAESVERINYI